MNAPQRLQPRILRQCFCALCTPLEHYRQNARGRNTTSGFVRCESNGGNGGLNRIRSPQMQPMLSRKVKEGEQFFSLFGQTLDGLRGLGIKRFNTAVKGFLGICFGGSGIDRFEGRFRLRLLALRQVVEHIRRFV